MNQSQLITSCLINPILTSTNVIEQTDHRIFKVQTEDEKTKIIDSQFEKLQKEFCKPNHAEDY